jgi:tRNA(Ile)-lysidine synthase
MTSIINDPIHPDELDGLFAALLRGRGPVALAVSGGCDSTALAVLFADWLRQRGDDAALHTVLTVDHGLRTKSAAEAALVSRLATSLGFRHAILAWQGPKPYSGVQAAARAARYRLMGEYARAHGIATLVTAHTRDDQAETLLMRLARGSGVDGLAAMAPSTVMGPVRLARPLLDTPKARLRATLVARAIAWIEDPTNQSPAFERTRLRASREALDALGLTGDALASSARRLQRARAALECIADDFCAEPGAIGVDRCGVLRIDRERFARAPEEIGLRVLARCIAAAGGAAEPMPLGKLEPIVTSLRSGADTGSWTLSRALVSVDRDIQVEREPGRHPLPQLALRGGATAVWDGRFAVALVAGFEGTVDVRALGPDGLADLRRGGHPVKATRALYLVPSFWREGALLAAPTIGFWANSDLEGRLSAGFLGLRYNLDPPGGPRSAEFTRFC